MIALYYPYPLDQGSNIRIFNLLKNLSTRHTVDLITFAHDGADPSPGLENLQKYCTRVDVVAQNGRAHNGLEKAKAFLSPLPRSVVLDKSPAMVEAIETALERQRYDVVLAEWLWLASYVGHLQKAALVLEDLNAEAAAFERALRLEGGSLPKRLRNGLTWLKLRHFERWATRTFDATTTVSEIDRQRLIAQGGEGDKIVAVPNGVDTQTIAFQAYPVAPNIVIYPGSMTYSPNLDACLYFTQEIFPLIRQKYSEAEYVITGKIPQTLPSSLTETPNVRLLGYVDDVKPVVGGSAVCAVPLRQGGGTRLKILEAMALGTPVVATSVAAEGLDVTHGVDILLADTPEEFAAHVVALLTDTELRQKIATSARRLVETRYDWEPITVALEAVLQQAVSHRQTLPAK